MTTFSAAPVSTVCVRCGAHREPGSFACARCLEQHSLRHHVTRVLAGHEAVDIYGFEGKKHLYLRGKGTRQALRPNGIAFCGATISGYQKIEFMARVEAFDASKMTEVCSRCLEAGK